MTQNSNTVKRTYYLLTLLSTLAASFIWGVNTLFLLDAGLSNTAAFAANAFFTVGQVLFEVPTGVVADTKGRRTSYALGAGTLLVTTLAYLWLWQAHGPFWAWAIVSVGLGLGFTFFSGATEAWLVDALKFTGFTGSLESVFARGQATAGIAMLVGSVSGGFIAQHTNLGVPYLIRAGLLAVTLVVCLFMMRDWGFTPRTGETALQAVRTVLKGAMDEGFRKPPVRYLLLGAPFAGIGIYIFYACQPYLLQLYGDPHAYGIAGLAAAIVAGAQIVGGLCALYVKKIFRTRTSVLISATAVGTVAIVLLGLMPHFWIAIALLVVWGLMFSLTAPVRQAYMNGLINSEQRATVLSFDNLMGSSGGAVAQPILGRTADVYGYPQSFLVSAAIAAGSLPFLIMAHKQKASSDPLT